ncbi:replication-associated recombination protein A [Fulvivirga sediminis]|uniref:Replication-associated recombination protein A n=1 Tax=Fulvivirga sediminis TaxID=2803949 RepID=A0A937FAJ5_9BACT|nr:replication-associated recombination protein A [Fulvivirga sediminis]MBL3656943.1 replication-associated recombination protein A [Fulvivirga sediminis]
MFDLNLPLAERMRPTQLEDLIGQEHLVGPNGILRKTIKSGVIPSMILWGPPGVGKTTIANIIANEINSPFYTLSAISSGVKDVREVIDKAKRQSKAILFIDEIHRFNKAQQDALLGAVEKGTITLIGATTENPSFEVNSALLSRSQVYTLKSLTEQDQINLIHHVLNKDEKLKKKTVKLEEHAALLSIAGGDARKLLNLLDLVCDSIPGDEISITDQQVMDIAQQKVAIYDKSGEQHYDIISAFIKSIRGSDPNAAVYYLARMIEGGEDIKYIARRLLILASEDIGNANPTALVIANNTFQAVTVIGYPEGQIVLSQCATYLACSAKSNASYNAINRARAIVKQTGDLKVPMAIRNAPTKLMKDSGYGQGYKYAHDYPNNFAPMEFLPDEIKNSVFYDPGKNAREEEMRKRLRALWKDKYGY